MARLTEIIEKVKPSIVAIGFTFASNGRMEPSDIVGTGFIISEKGYVCTCAHVITGKQGQLRVSVRGDGGYPHAPSEVVLLDKERDIAIIKLPPPSPELTTKLNIKFEPVELGDSKGIKEGQEIIFCGFPFGGGVGGGFAPSTTRGIVSALRPKQIGDLTTYHFQLDAMVSEGHSGSPLIDIETGKVIGIVNARFDPMLAGSQIIIGGRPLTSPTNIGFAIPINLVKPLINTLIKRE